MADRKKDLTLFLVIPALFFAELMVFDKLRIFGVRPELLLIATIFFGFRFGALRGLQAGAISGILKDIFSVSGFGAHALSFLLAGFLSSRLRSKLFKENFITEALLAFLAVYLTSTLYFLYPGITASGGITAQFWRMVLYKALYTGAAAPLLFFILGRFFGFGEKSGA